VDPLPILQRDWLRFFFGFLRNLYGETKLQEEGN
jgi:hypothetical protein